MRLIIFVYGWLTYAFFFATFVYFVGFSEGLVVPKTVDLGASGLPLPAWLSDIGAIVLFGVQHSIMARARFKQALTRILPRSAERSSFVLVSSLLLVFLFWGWAPIPAIVWDVRAPTARLLLHSVSYFGWTVVLVSTFLIDHFELFGVRQVTRALLGRGDPEQKMRTPSLYRVVRHPLYLGFIIALGVAPTMTMGHLLLAGGFTAYILVGVVFEERDLIRAFGQEYLGYQARVGRILPSVRRQRVSSRAAHDRAHSDARPEG